MFSKTLRHFFPLWCPLTAFIISCCQQACNHCSDDEDDEDGSGAEECPENLVLFGSDNDELEGESEDDNWFDALVERQLSGISVEPTEPDDLPSDSQVLDSHPGWPYDLEGPSDSQPMESQKLDDAVFSSPRPVARPLQASNPEQSQAKVVVLDDDDDEQSQVAALDLRARRIAELKAKIAELESMQGELQTSAGWGPGSFSICMIEKYKIDICASLYDVYGVVFMHLWMCLVDLSHHTLKLT